MEAKHDACSKCGTDKVYIYSRGMCLDCQIIWMKENKKKSDEEEVKERERSKLARRKNYKEMMKRFPAWISHYQNLYDNETGSPK